MTDLKPPWHLRPSTLVPDYSDLYDADGTPICRFVRLNDSPVVQAILAAPGVLEQRDELLEAAEDFRDAVLHERLQLAEMGMGPDLVNAVLGLFDDTFDSVIAKTGGDQ